MASPRAQALCGGRPRPCPTLTYPTVLYPTLPYPTAPHSTVPYPTAPYRTALYCTVLYRTVLHRTVPYRTAPHRTAPYATHDDRPLSSHLTAAVAWLRGCVVLESATSLDLDDTIRHTPYAVRRTPYAIRHKQPWRNRQRKVAPGSRRSSMPP